MKIDGGAPSQRGPDQPAKSDTEEAAEQPHDASFGEEEAAHVAVSGAKRFQDADFAAAFEDGHH